MALISCNNAFNFAGITIESDGQPENQTRMYGETVLFAVSATASNEGDLNYLRYQWRCKTEGDDDFIPVVDKNDMNYSGAEKPTLKLKNFSSKHVGIYYCVITFKFGGSESDCKDSNEVLLKSCGECTAGCRYNALANGACVYVICDYTGLTAFLYVLYSFLLLNLAAKLRQKVPAIT